MSRALPIRVPGEDAPSGVSQLRQTLHLVEQIAGQQPADDDWAAFLHDDAVLVSAYAAVPDITRRRFDAVAAEAAAYATVGVRALIGRGGEARARAAAAACLAAELRRSLATLTELLSATPRA